MILASWSEIKRLVAKSDVVLEVVDARIPPWTRSKKLERIVKSFRRKLVLVLNKADLVPKPVVEEWKKFFEERDNYPTVYFSIHDRSSIRVLKKIILNIVDKTPILITIVGYPKVGKSSIINMLKGKHSASTSPIPGSPGYTHHVQLYRIDDNIYMFDTPGILPIEGDRLEMILRGRPPEKLKDPVTPAVELIERALKYNPFAIIEAYNIHEKDPYKILEILAKRRGWFYKSTHEPNIEEAARTVIRDWHNAKLTFYITVRDYLEYLNQQKTSLKF